MRDINEVTLAGRLGEDAVSRSFQGGGGAVSFSLATSRKWKDKAGEWKESTQWHRVVLFDDRCRTLATGARKGDRVLVRGEAQTRKYKDRDDREQRVTEIVVQQFTGTFEFLDAAREATAFARDGGGSAAGSGRAGDSGAPPPDLDDDVPF